MGALSTTTQTNAYNWAKGTSFPTAPTALYLATYNGDPSGGGTENTTTIRTAGRVAVTFAAASGRAIVSNLLADFGAAAGAATVTHWALFSAVSAGTRYAEGSFTATNNVALGEEFSVASGAITISAPAGMMSDYFVHMVLNWLRGTAAPAASATRHVAIFNGDPQAAGSDVSGTISTGRKTATLTGTGPVTNAALVDFGNAVTGGTITHLAVFDAASAGNLLLSKSLTSTPSTATPQTGEAVRVDASALSFTIN